jgi:hypothetical protein
MRSLTGDSGFAERHLLHLNHISQARGSGPVGQIEEGEADKGK